MVEITPSSQPKNAGLSGCPEKVHIIANPDGRLQAICIDDADPSSTVQIGAGLDPKQELALNTFLRANTEVFFQSPSDMPGVPREVIEHKLSVRHDARPVKRKVRWFALDRKEALREEIDKLLEAGFI